MIIEWVSMAVMSVHNKRVLSGFCSTSSTAGRATSCHFKDGWPTTSRISNLVVGIVGCSMSPDSALCQVSWYIRGT